MRNDFARGQHRDTYSRLAIDCRMLFMSGIGRYLREILSRIPDPNTEFVAVCSEIQQESWLMARFPNVKCVTLSERIYSLGEQLRLPSLLKNVKVIWTPHYNFPVFSSAKQVVTVHDLAHLALPDIFGKGAKRLYAKLMLKAVALRATEVIFVSDFTRREFSRLVGSPHAGTTVVRNGIGSEWFKPQPNVAGNYLLYVGNVKPHKNLGRMIAAFTNISRDLSLNLRIVGKREGFITGDILMGLKDSSIEKRVEFTGEISDEELIGQYAGADALIFPSLYEGFGFPPLEAMAAGCPVVVSNAASLPEICGEEFNPERGTGNVLYFDPNDVSSIERVIRRFLTFTESERSTMTKNARNHARKFDWERTASETWSIISEQLARVG